MFKSLCTRNFNTLYRSKQNGLQSKFCVVLGTQWGDEGKGKLVDILAKDFDVCARFNGGANAGHTVKVGNEKYGFHLLPCGILYENCVNVLGNGVVVNLQSMFEELTQLEKNNRDYKNRLFLSTRAHLVTKAHLEADAALEEIKGSGQIGTTKKGIGPTYSTKILRTGIRLGELLKWESFEKKYLKLVEEMTSTFNLGEIDTKGELLELMELTNILKRDNMIVDTTELIHKYLAADKKVIAEGANATMLDIDFGTYPYVTSSSTSIGGVCTGLGVPPNKIDTVLGVVKAYTTRVGGGPFPSECLDDIGEFLQTKGFEFGVTTGRKRRCGWLDLNVLKYIQKLNGLTSINITKLDVLSGLKEIKIATKYTVDGKEISHMPADIEELESVKCVFETFKGWDEDISEMRKYEELPQNARDYLDFIERSLGVPITWIGVGPEREAIIQKF